MDKTWMVYGLIDPRSGNVFYVGITTNVASRMRSHMSDRASSAWNVCQVLQSDGLKPSHCVFGRYLDKLPAKILEGRLILSLPGLVNKKSFHGMPSSVLYPDWQDLRVSN